MPASRAELARAIEELVCRAARHLSPDVVRAIASAAKEERDETARGVLAAILERAASPRARSRALASDTGLPTFFVRVGCDFPCLADLQDALRDAVAGATRHEPLSVHTADILSGASRDENIGRGVPVVHYELVPQQDDCRVAVLLKGAASEGLSALWILQPGQGLDAAGDQLVSMVAGAGGRPCPPLIVGVGLGGTPEDAMLLSRRALLRHIGERAREPALAELESVWRDRLNAAGPGPMGLGGGTTALAVHVEAADRHTAFLAVGVSVACWSDRRAAVLIDRHGEAHW